MPVNYAHESHGFIPTRREGGGGDEKDEELKELNSGKFDLRLTRCCCLCCLFRGIRMEKEEGVAPAKQFGERDDSSRVLGNLSGDSIL